MDNPIERAIYSYLETRSDTSLQALDRALIDGELLVPVSGEVLEKTNNVFDVAVICVRTSAGGGAIPAFTTIDQLLKWKPEGVEFVPFKVPALLEMALGMPEISEIAVNIEGVPRGLIPRSDFARLLVRN